MTTFKLLENLNDGRILPYLLKNYDSSISHHPAWLRSIIRTFNHKNYYLILEDAEGNISSLYPFCLLKSSLTGKRISAPPFSNYCDQLLPAEVLSAALNFIMGNFLQYKKLELKSIKVYSSELSSFTNTQNFVTHFLELADSAEKSFNLLPKTSVRRCILKSDKNKLTVALCTDLKYLKLFYEFEISLRKKLRFPPLAFKFFFNIWDEFNKSNQINIPIILKDKTPIAGGFIPDFKKTYYLEYTASDKNYFHLNSDHKLFWEVIKLAHSTGADRIDFGRS